MTYMNVAAYLAGVLVVVALYVLYDQWRARHG
jgi:hypothetical protein